MEHVIHCMGCGLCFRECRLQADAIRPIDNGVMIHLEQCNRCGHCAAVCPTGAMDHPLLAPRQEEIGELLSPERALRFLRTPRSVRQYKSEPVPRALLCRLLDAGRYPQTAKNSQGIGYLVVQGEKRVAQIHCLYHDIVCSLPESDPDRDILMRPILVEQKHGFDALFYRCPQLIFAVCDVKNSAGSRNAQFSLTFISLMAPSLGLGTCWSGQLERLACRKEFMPRFAELIGLPPDQRICGCMMVGYPSVRFRRLAARDPLRVAWRGDTGGFA